MDRPDEGAMRGRGLPRWPVQETEVSESERHCDGRGTCRIPEGRVRVEPGGGGEPVELGPGDLVTFPEGLDRTWNVRQPVRKHYRFG